MSLTVAAKEVFTKENHRINCWRTNVFFIFPFESLNLFFSIFLSSEYIKIVKEKKACFPSKGFQYPLVSGLIQN